MRNLKLSVLFSAMIFLFASCVNQEEYTTVIPADATAIVAVDLKSIVEDGDLANTYAASALNEAVSMLSTEGKDGVGEFLKQPDMIGIDFFMPAYFFRTENNCMGVTVKLHDSDSFEVLLQLLALQGVATKPTQRNGLMWSALLEDIDIVYTDKTCLFVWSLANGGSAIRQQIAGSLMTLATERMFVSTPQYKLMQERMDNHVVAMTRGDEMPFLKSLSPVSNITPESQFQQIYTLNFESGKMVCSSQFVSEDPHVVASIDSLNRQLHDIEGRYVDAPAEDFLLWAGLSIKGNMLLDLLKQDKEVKSTLSMLGMIMDIEKMVKAVDGDVAVMLPSPTDFSMSTDTLPDFTILATMGNTDFMKDADYWIESVNKMNNQQVRMQRLETDRYLLEANGFKLHWGLDGDDLFFATVDDYVNNSFKQRSTLLKEYEDVIRHNKIFIYVNLSSLPMGELAQVVQINPIFAQGLGNLKALIVKSQSVDKFSVEVILKNENENFLKQLL